MREGWVNQIHPIAFRAALPGRGDRCNRTTGKGGGIYIYLLMVMMVLVAGGTMLAFEHFVA